MTDVMEGVDLALGAQSASTQKTVSCEWKNCKANHSEKPKYPANGTVDRNTSYATEWVSAKLEPWEKYGAGQPSHATLADYRNEVPSAAYAVSAAALQHPEYHTQKHHLLSVKLFSNVADLSHDAKLAGYDVNSANNGVCLPSFVVDIVRHDLQCHRGNHPNDLYYDKIRPLLREIEDRCVKYCQADLVGESVRQLSVVDDLDRLSERAERQLKNWRWLLRTNALAERIESRSRLAARKSTTAV
jgi:hypothetical protein